jgi:hypothetical protein
MENSNKPTYNELYNWYNELYNWYNEEKRIKNHLYYYILFKGLLNGYYAYFQAYGNDIEEKEKQDGKLFRILLLADNLQSCLNTVKNKTVVKVTYDIMPN